MRNAALFGSYARGEATPESDMKDAQVNAELAVSLGLTPFFLNGESEPGVRTHETNLGDFFADALRWTAEYELGQTVDLGIVNGGAIRASIDAGDISLKTIKIVVPYSGELVALDVTGAQLLEALEAACQAIGKERAIGAFPQVSGMTFTVDASVRYEEGPLYPDSEYPAPAAIGSRVTISDVGGRAFDPDTSYLVACTDFMSEGGDTYHAFKEAADAEEPVTFCFDFEAIVSYLVQGCDHTVPDEYAAPQGRITIIGAE